MDIETHKNITITVDKNYCIYAAVMLHSFFMNNAAQDCFIHIVTNVRNGFYKIPLYYILKRHKAKYKFYFIEEQTLRTSSNLVISHHITIATYFRLFLPSILSKVDKALFLDSDMIIDANISELYQTDINQYSLAAVSTPTEKREKTLALSKHYFNAGMMLLNLSFWRERQFEHLFMQYINDNPEKIMFWDQDVLNATAGQYMLPVSSKWNVMSNNHTNQEVPAIIHYAGIHKPWAGHSEHRLKDKYFQYLHTDSVLTFLEKSYRFYFRICTRLKK